MNLIFKTTKLFRNMRKLEKCEHSEYLMTWRNSCQYFRRNSTAIVCVHTHAYKRIFSILSFSKNLKIQTFHRGPGISKLHMPVSFPFPRPRGVWPGSTASSFIFTICRKLANLYYKITRCNFRHFNNAYEHSFDVWVCFPITWDGESG